METNPNFEDVTVSERPQNQTIQGKVVSVIKATRQELYEVESEEDLMYDNQSLDDEIVQIEVVAEHKGHEFTVYEDLRFYENPSDRSKFGAFIKRYGKPEEGLEVTVDFDEDGEGQVVGIRNN